MKTKWNKKENANSGNKLSETFDTNFFLGHRSNIYISIIYLRVYVIHWLITKKHVFKIVLRLDHERKK